MTLRVDKLGARFSFFCFIEVKNESLFRWSVQTQSEMQPESHSRVSRIRDGFRYLVIQSGYATRLVKHLDSIKKNLKEMCYKHKKPDCDCDKQVLFVNETIWCNEITAIDGTPEEINYLRVNVGRNLAGSIAFRCASLNDAMRIAQMLVQYEHCYGFDMSGLCQIETKNDILFLEFDCESG